MSTRHVDLSRSEQDLAINIRKATNIEETAPKRKHVRSCIVYTWDHKSSQSFWAGMKVQPIQADEVQTFKALICIHKVLQEGHPVTIREAHQHTGWLESLMRSIAGDGLRGYGPLIREYVFFLLSKLRFHRHHPEFNGTFEYEEYISLKTINDPNEGYETITDLMKLQDQIDSFQKLVFSHFRHGANNECKIASLVPLVHESYGIYRFVTSMLRAMHTSTGNDEVLEPLRTTYNAQHYRLVKFYYECSTLRYLTSLITVPKLPQDPPNLMSEEEQPPALPKRPSNEPTPKPPSPTPTPPVSVPAPEPEPIADFWSTEQNQKQKEYEEQQRRLQEQWAAELQQQQLNALRQQQEFEENQRQLLEAQRKAQEQLARDQFARQTQGQLADMEQQLLAMKGQWDRDQMILQHYDSTIKNLETELSQLKLNSQQQLATKDDLIKSLQEQVNMWKSKYEALAKLYSQLRHEHLDLLGKFKQLQLKAASAQEAIDKREKLEKEMKTKNLELADMIRERDRALFDLDRAKGSNKEELEKVKRELKFALEKAENVDRSKGTELSALLKGHNREVADLEELLRQKQREIDALSRKAHEGTAELEKLLREKEEELEIAKAGMDHTLKLLLEAENKDTAKDDALDSAIDAMLADHLGKLAEIMDSVLQSGVQRVDDALYELESTMQAGNQNASPSYLLSQVEKAGLTSTEFSTAFNNYIADGPNSPQSEVIKMVSIFASAIADVLDNAKGVTRLAPDEKKADSILSAARQSAQATAKFFQSLLSFRIGDLTPEQKTDVVLANNLEVQKNLQKLTKLTETFVSKSVTLGGGDLGDIVDRELTNAAAAIDAAATRLAALQSKAKGPGYSTYELRIHDSILDAAIAVTNAIAQLIKAATVSQQEIVAQGKGSSSRTAFYKRNNRWTEGLISAAKAVASSTNMLIETADGVISGTRKLEQLIVCANDVSASTAQLVAASRVKAAFASSSQEKLEMASKAVTGACRNLVKQVQEIIKERNREDGGELTADDYAKMNSHEFKVREMEQQVEILQLENALQQARIRLGEMRKVSYAEQE
ncbi:ANTH domain-containing protein [Kalaharituber pfeilii]|nr:ANTH domain-containing protein [Kalaharituber pfeilii]